MSTMHNPSTSPARVRFAAWATLGSLAVTLGLAGCGRSEDTRGAGQRADEPIARVEKSGETIGEKARQAGAEARQEAREAGTEMRNAVDDAAITATVNAELARDKDLSALRIDVDTVQGRVALKGTAPTAAARERATQIASAVKGVQAVDNQLKVGNG